MLILMLLMHQVDGIDFMLARCNCGEPFMALVCASFTWKLTRLLQPTNYIACV